MNKWDNLYFRTPVILRREYFGGILYLIRERRYLELNESAFAILKQIANENASIDNIFKSIGFVEDVVKTDTIKFIEDLLLNHILCVEKEKAEYVKVTDNFNKKCNVISAPIEGYFYLTSKCNQKCSFCYFDKQSFQNTVNLDKWIALVEEFIDIGGCTLGFLGGEPLLEREVLLRLLEYSDGKLSQVITTNGTANGGINLELANILAQFQALEINISIEALQNDVHDKMVALPGALEIAKKSIQNLIAAGHQSVVVKTIATKSNYKSIVELIKWAKDMGVSGVYIMDYMPSKGETYEDFSSISLPTDLYWELLNEAERFANEDFFVLANTKYRFTHLTKKLPAVSEFSNKISTCAAGSINIDIMPNGDVYSCPITNGNPDYCLGNIKEKRILELWNSDKLDVFRYKKTSRLRAPGCINCDEKYQCNGGCLVAAEIFTGNMYGGDLRCPKLQNTFPIKY